MRILVIGASGFLGTELCKVLRERGYEIQSGVRRRKIETEIEIPLNGTINLQSGEKPSLIVDVSNKYIPFETDEAIKSMSKTILGVAKTILRSNESWNAPILQTTSYLQYCPRELQPWNKYSEIRNKSLEILKQSARQQGSGIAELIVHDTYGEVPRNKFLDLCLDAIKTGNSFNAGCGKSVINLTHISDICTFIADQISSLTSGVEKEIKWDFKSSDTYTLKSLVKLLEEMSGKSNFVNWGILNNPRREVLKVWKIPGAIEAFNTKISLRDWLARKLSTGL